MKVHLELNSDTLADVRPELEAFLGLGGTVASPKAAEMTKAAALRPHPEVVDAPEALVPVVPPLAVVAVEAQTNAGDLAPEITPVDTIARPAPKARRTRSAADIALGLGSDDDEEESDSEVDPNGTVETAAAQPEADSVLADRAQLSFDFDRVLALQGRAAALGIVQGVLPPGKRTKLKDIEMLPVELIPAAIAALQAAGAN
jgi:hypothetical protein